MDTRLRKKFSFSNEIKPIKYIKMKVFRHFINLNNCGPN